jgi:hypothetical protein
MEHLYLFELERLSYAMIVGMFLWAFGLILIFRPKWLAYAFLMFLVGALLFGKIEGVRSGNTLLIEKYAGPLYRP